MSFGWAVSEDIINSIVPVTNSQKQTLMLTGFPVANIPEVRCAFMTYNGPECQYSDFDLDHTYIMEKGGRFTDLCLWRRE
jgi:hypothetical protein